MTEPARTIKPMPSLGRRILRRARRAIGIDDAPGAAEWRMDAGLARAAARHEIATIIDVGASDGSWSRVARRHWPAARFLLIEALPYHEPALRASGFDYVIAAAGDALGEITFNSPEPYGGAASHSTIGAGDVTVPMTTIDAEVSRRGLPAPYLIKLDTHGFEPEIVAGAAATLTAAELLVIEAYNFELRPGVPRFHELCALLAAKGFRVLDLLDPMHRPSDGVLWQMDLVFARVDDPAFRNSGYT